MSDRPDAVAFFRSSRARRRPAGPPRSHRRLGCNLAGKMVMIVLFAALAAALAGCTGPDPPGGDRHSSEFVGEMIVMPAAATVVTPVVLAADIVVLPPLVIEHALFGNHPKPAAPGQASPAGAPTPQSARPEDPPPAAWNKLAPPPGREQRSAVGGL